MDSRNKSFDSRYVHGAIVEKSNRITNLFIKLRTMKQVTTVTIPRIFLACFFSLFTLAVWAQDSSTGGGETKSSTTTTTRSTDVNITNSAGDNWYTQPWVWIVGAAVFILLLVALLGGSKKGSTASTTDRLTVKKTVERDTDSDL